MGFDGRLRPPLYVPEFHHEAHDRLHELLQHRYVCSHGAALSQMALCRSGTSKHPPHPARTKGCTIVQSHRGCELHGMCCQKPVTDELMPLCARHRLSTVSSTSSRQPLQVKVMVPVSVLQCCRASAMPWKQRLTAACASEQACRCGMAERLVPQGRHLHHGVAHEPHRAATHKREQIAGRHRQHLPEPRASPLC